MDARKKAGMSRQILILFVQAILLGLAAAMALLCLFARVLVAVELPEISALAFSCVSVCVGAFLSGLHLARGVGRSGLICGAVCAAFWSLCFLLAALGCGFGPEWKELSLRLLCFFPCSMIGGYVGVGLACRPQRMRRKG